MSATIVMPGSTTSTDPIDLAPLPAPEATVLDRIKAQLAAEREKAAASTTFVLPVPRHPSVLIEFTALTQAVWQAIQEEGAKTDAKPVDTQARLLIEACSGIFVEFDGQTFPAAESLGGRPPTFKGDLEAVGKLVGIPYAGVRGEWVKALYVTDGDLISTSAAVLDLSGFARAAEIEASVKGK
jgi:hypothetical protein